MPDPLIVFERFKSNRASVPDRTGEPRPMQGALPGGRRERRGGVYFGAEELSLLCAGVVAVAAASFFLGWYGRGKAGTGAEPRPVREEVETWRVEDLRRALEPVPVSYGLSAGVYATEREARARASSFTARGLVSRVIEDGSGYAVVVGEFGDPSRASRSALGEELRGSRPVRLP